MLDKTFTTLLPFPLDVVERAWLWSVATETLAAKQKGEMNARILINTLQADPATGRPVRYTLKEYDLRNKLPKAIASLVPLKYQTFTEEAWNAFPRCTTVIRIRSDPSDPARFSIRIETDHLPLSSGKTQVIKRVQIQVHLPLGAGGLIERQIWSSQKDAFERVYQNLIETEAQWRDKTEADITAKEQEVAFLLGGADPAA